MKPTDSTIMFPIPMKIEVKYRELLTYQANLSGLFDIENAKTEPQKERQQEEKKHRQVRCRR